MGFHVDPHEARQPQQKGKVERRVLACQQLLDLKRKYSSLEDLQNCTDLELSRKAKTQACPVTGKSVEETWLEEIKLLRKLPATLPDPFDLIRRCPVHKDSTIRFEGRTYAVPFRFVKSHVEVRGCNGFIQIVDPEKGEIVGKYPRNTDQKLFIDPQCYEGDSTAEVKAPRPLGAVSRKLEEIGKQAVSQRSIEINEQLAEVCR
jgi:hypothetical protein